MVENSHHVPGGDSERSRLCNRGKLSGGEGVAMRGRRAERREGNPNGLERIGGGEECLQG
jgi:hypothetical protein